MQTPTSVPQSADEPAIAKVVISTLAVRLECGLAAIRTAYDPLSFCVSFAMSVADDKPQFVFHCLMLDDETEAQRVEIVRGIYLRELEQSGERKAPSSVPDLATA